MVVGRACVYPCSLPHAVGNQLRLRPTVSISGQRSPIELAAPVSNRGLRTGIEPVSLDLRGACGNRTRVFRGPLGLPRIDAYAPRVCGCRLACSRATVTVAPRMHSRQIIRVTSPTGYTKKSESFELQQQHLAVPDTPNSVAASFLAVATLANQNRRYVRDVG